MGKLTDTQAIILAAASQRESASLYPLPETLRPGGGTAKAVAALVAAGYAEERETSDKEAVRRSDGDLGFGLFVTAAGLAAIGVEARGDEGVTSPPAAADTAAPARVTKAATVVALLERDSGATLPELIAATGWLPHTTRAALTGLRKKGHDIVRGTRDGATCYRIAVAA
ncbi:DUF3489 domain-containing protein [Sphingomonas sp. KR1UV-12]|uniref:DUF3489 domain-containing protein n=1 Tax=Sphingomonas aurea TaxID=3063994 RepID=A0ABT9EJ95_9SPHN|nr:DUF3489 domain-containing protein [Sphingomonas sp. KR1UV-12]MDP1027040.1 DUF3489 domain-containing protein [Sphingomonas sp. KR1UV-12]